jgi:hypothetical protein
MKTKILFLVMLLLLASPALLAQSGYVTVTGTVQSYAGGQITGSFVNGSTAPQLPLLNGSIFPTTIVTNLDVNGTFSAAVADNTVIQPNPSQWQFILCAKAGNPSQPCYPVTLTVTCVSNPSCVSGKLDISSAFAGAPAPPTPPNLLNYVDKTSAQTITGLKTFSTGPNLSDGSAAASQNYVNLLLNSVASPFTPGTGAASLAQTANGNIAQNSTALFTDGTQAYSAGPAYASLGTFIDDAALAAMHNPKAFPAANIINLVNKFIAVKNGNGEFPIAVNLNGTSAACYSAWDLHHAYCTGDGWIMVPQMLYLYCQDVGLTSTACINAYNADVAPIKTALAFPPRNGTTGLITVNPGNEYVAGMAFMEYMRNTGDVANANVWYAIVCQKMAAMATAAGDSANVTFFNTQYANTVAGIKANLIDATSGMLKAATIQNSANLDVVSSVLADYYGLLTTAQNTAIETYISAHFATLVNSDGYILETPGGWGTIGYIPAGGGPPYGAAGFTSTQYQGGYWSFFFAEFAAVLAKTNANPAAPGQVSTLLNDFLNGADPNTEYYNVGSTTPQGTTPNLESPQGPLWTAQNYPLLVSGGGTTVAVPAQVTYQGGPNNLIQNYSSSSTSNTANYYTNSSGSGYQEADLLEGSAGPNPGSRCDLIITRAGVTINLLPFCIVGVSSTTGAVRLGLHTSLQWMNTDNADSFTAAGGLWVVPGTATVSVDDGVTPGDAKGSIQDALTITNELAFKGTTFTVSGATTPIGGSTAGTYVCASAGTCTAVVTVGAGTPSPTHGWLTLEARDDSTPAGACSSTSRTGTTVTLTCTSVAASDVIEFALAAY